MFCSYIKEAAAKQELNRSRSLQFSLQQELELEPESNFQEQDWFGVKNFGLRSPLIQMYMATHLHTLLINPVCFLFSGAFKPTKANIDK